MTKREKLARALDPEHFKRWDKYAERKGFTPEEKVQEQRERLAKGGRTASIFAAVDRILEALKYEDGADEEVLVLAATVAHIDAVSLAEAWDRMLDEYRGGL